MRRRKPTPRPLASNLARYGSSAAMFAAMAMAAASLSKAATSLFWDSDPAPNDTTTGAGLGGTGVWNDVNPPLWYDGAVSTTWPNATPSDATAIFTGTAGTVSLGT